MSDVSNRPVSLGAKVIDFLRDGTGLLAGIAVLLLMLHIVIDTIMRFLFNQPLAGTLEFVTFWWMVSIGFGAWGLAEKRGEHIEATALYDLMPPRTKRVWRNSGRVVTVITMLLLAFYGLQEALKQQAFGEFGGGAMTPIWPMRYWVFVGALLFAVEVIRGFRQPISEYEDEDDIDLV